MFRSLAYIICFVVVSAPFSFAQTEPESKTTSERYKDWTFNCIAVNGIEQCEIVTRIIAQDGSVFSQISVQIKDGMTEPLLQIAVPVMSDLKVPLVMNFELEEAVEFQYSFCNAQACFIVEPSSENVLNYLKQKNDVILTLRSIVNGDVRARASLLGFSDAFARLNEYPNDE